MMKELTRLEQMMNELMVADLIVATDESVPENVKHIYVAMKQVYLKKVGGK